MRVLLLGYMVEVLAVAVAVAVAADQAEILARMKVRFPQFVA
jgi:hypothetical protein